MEKYAFNDISCNRSLCGNHIAAAFSYGKPTGTTILLKASAKLRAV